MSALAPRVEKLAERAARLTPAAILSGGANELLADMLALLVELAERVDYVTPYIDDDAA